MRAATPPTCPSRKPARRSAMQPPLEARARNVLHSESRTVALSLRLGNPPAHAVAAGLMSVIDRHTPPALLLEPSWNSFGRVPTP